MSRSWAAGGVLAGMAVAGVVLLPSSGTLALLSDRTVVAAEAGAASLALTAAPTAVDGVAPAALVLPGEGTGVVQVATTGELPWTLRVEVLDAGGGEDCDVAGRLGAGSAVGSEVVPVGEDCGVLLTREGTGPTTGEITLHQVDGSGAGAWTGLLRLTLQQRSGGFSDLVDLPLQLVGDDGAAAGAPDAGRPVEPGDGSGGPPTAGRPGAVGTPSGSAPGTADPTPGSAPAAGSASTSASTSGSASDAPSTSGAPGGAPPSSAGAAPEPAPEVSGPGPTPDDGGTSDETAPEDPTTSADPVAEG